MGERSHGPHSRRTGWLQAAEGAEGAGLATQASRELQALAAAASGPDQIGPRVETATGYIDLRTRDARAGTARCERRECRQGRWASLRWRAAGAW